MTNFQKKAFVVIVLFQILCLGLMVGDRVYVLEKGSPVLLKCRPIDPRSLLSGDYVILNYEISSVHVGNIPFLGKATHRLKRGDKVYVALNKNPNDDYFSPAAVSDDRDVLNEAGYRLVIEGRIKNPRGIHYAKGVPRGRLQIDYGVEAYFVPQGQGREIEKNMRNTSVLVSLSKSGKSAVKKIFINDKEIIFN